MSRDSLICIYLVLFIPIIILGQEFQSQNDSEEQRINYRRTETNLTRNHSLFPQASTGIWTEVHPLIPRVDYWGVHFVNADSGWAVGEGGAIIKTTESSGSEVPIC